MTEDVSALTSDNDYIAIATQTHTFVGGERTLSIPVKINGDSNVEPNETFRFKIFNASDNLKLSASTISAEGSILNDDSPPELINNVGEFKFDDCGAQEWKIDHSSIGNDVSSGTPTVIDSDGKAYMCNSLNGVSGIVTIDHHAAYEIDNGTISMLLYDHHNVWETNSWMFEKGALKVEVVRVGGDLHKGSIKVTLDGNVIDTQEVFLTNSDGGDLDTQWIHVALSFGTQGMKLYINGIEKGTHAHTGGINTISDDFQLGSLSGYIDEFYIFDGQMSTLQVNSLYLNTTNNKNIDGTDRDCICYSPSDPFTCDSSMYISSSTNRVTSATGKMWLHRVNTTQNPFNFEVMEGTGATELYNATAYNPDDNYIYGLYHTELIQLSRTAQATSLGNVVGLPSRFSTKQLYAGAIADGYYYVTGRNSKQKDLYKINLADKSVTTLTLSQEVAIQDFSFYKNVNDTIPDNTFLHGVDTDGKLIKIDVRDGTTTSIGSDHVGYQFDSSFSDKNGRFFANDSNGNGFFEFDLLTGTKNLVSNAQSATFNDGANCINAALVFNDYGDAPASYGTPRHNLANGIFMGATIDHDTYTFDSNNSDGDDLDGIDDEDGVTLLDGSDLNGQFLPLNSITKVKVNVLKGGYLNTWIDYNIDGDFNDAGEKIVTSRYLTAGTHTISINIPASLTSNTTTYMRFRYSSVATLSPTGVAIDGEVEDYAIQFGSDVLKGAFNIERTNSSLYAIMSDERNAWYTQIVGRDFDYAVVFYEEDFSSTQEAVDLTYKIELYNNETNGSISEMLPYYGHFSSSFPTHRQNFTSTSDLNQLSAYKDVEFRISYATDGSDGIIQEACPSGNLEQCFETLALTHTIKTVSAKDNFAIRPERFFMRLKDQDVEKVNSDYPVPSIKLASGYEYNLSIIATEYNKQSLAKGYSYTSSESFDFNNTGLSACRDTSAIIENIDVTNGLHNNRSFKHDEVGHYTLNLQDDNNWTKIDRDNSDCIVNSSVTSSDANLKSGCNIALAINPLNVSFYPHHFDVALVMENLPNSSHDDFIYMSELNSTYNSVALGFTGKIIAQSENNSTTENFSDGCMATNILLDLNASTVSVEGSNSQIKSIAGTDINFTRYVQFNADSSSPSMDLNKALSRISNTLSINKNKFLDENNGTLTLDMRYNLNKHPSEPINPVEVTFSTIQVNANDASSVAHTIDNYLPTGKKSFVNNKKNFYFAKVVSDLDNYPEINLNISPMVITPLNVDIYCKTTTVNYCVKTVGFMTTPTSHPPPESKEDGIFQPIIMGTPMGM